MTTPVGSIEFACPFCEKVTRVPATYAGKQGKCPGCQRVIEVPDPSAAGVAPAQQVTTFEPPPPGAVGSAVTGAHPAPGGAPLFEFSAGGGQSIGSPVTDVAPRPAGGDMGDDAGEATRPCPACGETIKAAAKKCKFCGEFLDERLRAQRRAPAAVPVGRLASPWSRLAAAFIDNLLAWVPTGLLVVAGAMVLENARSNGAQTALGLGLLGLAFLIYTGYHAYSWYLISTRGQNIPKGWLGIKIVRIDGQPVDFVSGVLLRNWVVAFLCLIPYLGTCIGLLVCLSYLMIFSQDRRCLHDHIASTVVVEA